MNIEVITETKYKVGGYTFYTEAGALHHVAKMEAVERSKEMAKDVREFCNWLANELRAIDLPYNSRGCAEFMLTYPDKVVEKLGYEVIEVE
jgi:hypothetical protein